jgi:hypothetical protein
VYTEIAAQHPGGIIDVPLLAGNTEYVFQIFHQQPILSGPGVVGPHTRPAGWADYVNENTFLQQLGVTTNRLAPFTGKYIQADLERLWIHGFRTVVVHPQESRRPVERIQDLIGTEGLSYGPKIFFPLPRPPGHTP